MAKFIFIGVHRPFKNKIKKSKGKWKSDKPIKVEFLEMECFMEWVNSQFTFG